MQSTSISKNTARIKQMYFDECNRKKVKNCSCTIILIQLDTDFNLKYIIHFELWYMNFYELLYHSFVKGTIVLANVNKC